MHEAKTQLSKLVDRALKGEDVVIAKSGVSKVRLVPVVSDGKDWFGMDEGKGWIAADFNETPSELILAIYGEDEEKDPS